MGSEEDNLIKKSEKILLISRLVKTPIQGPDHTDLLRISGIMTEMYMGVMGVRKGESVIWFLGKIQGFKKNERLIIINNYITNNYITPNT